MKYVIFKLDGRELPVLFPGMFAHRDIAESVRARYPKIDILSAGQFVLQGNEVITQGGSPSLDIPGRNSDAELIQREMNRVRT